MTGSVSSSNAAEMMTKSKSRQQRRWSPVEDWEVGWAVNVKRIFFSIWNCRNLGKFQVKFDNRQKFGSYGQPMHVNRSTPGNFAQ